MVPPSRALSSFRSPRTSLSFSLSLSQILSLKALSPFSVFLSPIFYMDNSRCDDDVCASFFLAVSLAVCAFLRRSEASRSNFTTPNPPLFGFESLCPTSISRERAFDCVSLRPSISFSLFASLAMLCSFAGGKNPPVERKRTGGTTETRRVRRGRGDTLLFGERKKRGGFRGEGGERHRRPGCQKTSCPLIT